MNVVTKIFQLRTNQDHYIEFQAGLDTFRFEFRWNEREQKYCLSIYKNYELKVDSYFIVWSLYNILDPFSYMKLGSLQCVVEDQERVEGEQGKYLEISKENIQTAIFRWDYELK